MEPSELTHTILLTVRNTSSVLVRCTQILSRQRHIITAARITPLSSASPKAHMVITTQGAPEAIPRLLLLLLKLADVLTAKQEENTMPGTYGPYTPVRRAGNMLFLSGHVGIDPATGSANKTIVAQTTQLFKNMAQTLEENGSSLQDIVKTTVFLTNMDDFTLMNNVYGTTFTAPRPARSTVGVRELPRVAKSTPLLVEVEAIAYLEQR